MRAHTYIGLITARQQACNSLIASTCTFLVVQNDMLETGSPLPPPPFTSPVLYISWSMQTCNDLPGTLPSGEGLLVVPTNLKDDIHAY